MAMAPARWLTGSWVRRQQRAYEDMLTAKRAAPTRRTRERSGGPFATVLRQAGRGLLLHLARPAPSFRLQAQRGQR